MRLMEKTVDNNVTVGAPEFSPAGPYLAWGGQIRKIASLGEDKVLQWAGGFKGGRPLVGVADLLHLKITTVEQDWEYARADFAPDGSRWLTRFSIRKGAATSQSVRVQRLGPDPLKRSLVLPESNAPPGGKGAGRNVSHIQMSQDGRHALLSTRSVEFNAPTEPIYGHDYLLEWWDLAEGKRLTVWNEGSPEKDLYAVTLVADGRFALTRSWMDAKAWDVADGKIKDTLSSQFGGLTGGLALSPDRRHLCHYVTAEIGADGLSKLKPTVLDIYEIATGKIVHHLELQDRHGGWGPIAFHLEAGWLAARHGGARRTVEPQNRQIVGALAAARRFRGRRCGLQPRRPNPGDHERHHVRLWPLPYLQQEIEKLEHGDR